MITTRIMALLVKRVSVLLLLHCALVYAGTIKDGFPCVKHEECVTGLHCVGKAGNERCKRPMVAGEYCGDPTWVCAKNLECQKVDNEEICVKVLSAGGYKCTEKGYACDTGLHCVGKPGYERCKKPMGYGENCGDPTWVCGEGLTCEGVRKEAVCVKSLSEGELCGGKFDRCVKGTTCENKKCVKEDPSPEEKIEPSPSPPSELTPKKKAARCDPGKSECKAGYHCVGRKGHEVCKKPMKEGESCRDPTWVCAEGLDCVGKGKNAFCRRPAPEEGTSSTDCGRGREPCKKPLKEGEQCSDPTAACEDGLYCVGKGRNAVCSKAGGLGQSCIGRLKCQSGLRCHRSRRGVTHCLKMLAVGAACGEEKFTFCTWGYHCLGEAGKKTCTKAVRRGKPVVKKKGKNSHRCCKCRD